MSNCGRDMDSYTGALHILEERPNVMAVPPDASPEFSGNNASDNTTNGLQR